MLSRAQLIEVLKANTDSGWIEPLLAEPNSAAVVNALADIASRMSVAVDHGCEDGLISLAPGGTVGTSFVTVTRAAGSGGGPLLFIPRGTLLIDERDAEYVTIDNSGPAPPSGPAVTLILKVESLRKTELVNTVDEPDMRFAPVSFVADASATSPIIITTTRPHMLGPDGSTQACRIRGVLGNTAANKISPIVILSPTTFELLGSIFNGGYLGGGLVQGAPDLFGVDTATPVIGANSDYLSAHGNERGQKRQGSEGVEAYRLRVRNIPDMVSPKAVAEAVRGVAESLEIPGVVVLEPENDGADPILKEELGLGNFDPLYLGPDGDFVDDAAFELVDARQACAYFRVEGPAALADPDALRYFLSGVTATPPDGGGFLADPTDPGYITYDIFGFLDVHDHPDVISKLMAISEEAGRKKPACVQYDVDLPLWRHLVDSSIIVPTLLADPGRSWILIEGIASHDAALSGVAPDPALDNHQVLFTFTDASTFTTAAWSDLWSETLLPGKIPGFPSTKRIAQIDMILTSGSGSTLNGVLDFLVAEVTD